MTNPYSYYSSNIKMKQYYLLERVMLDETIEDFFFGEDFQLPANMGFSKEGLILLYNNYEIAAYTQGATKIVLPYETVKGVLHINP